MFPQLRLTGVDPTMPSRSVVFALVACCWLAAEAWGQYDVVEGAEPATIQVYQATPDGTMTIQSSPQSPNANQPTPGYAPPGAVPGRPGMVIDPKTGKPMPIDPKTGKPIAIDPKTGKPIGADPKTGKPSGEPGKPGEKPEGEEERPATITRTEKPTEPADPEELKVRPGPDGVVRFQFRGQTWPDLLEWLAEISGMSVDWQELPNDFVNISTQRGYTVEEVRDLFNRLLSTLVSPPRSRWAVRCTTPLAEA